MMITSILKSKLGNLLIQIHFILGLHANNFGYGKVV